jgi:uncharacterized membrane protein
MMQQLGIHHNWTHCLLTLQRFTTSKQETFPRALSLFYLPYEFMQNVKGQNLLAVAVKCLLSSMLQLMSGFVIASQPRSVMKVQICNISLHKL